jgi:diguanylate cyclase (GGDEF)-like protein
MPRRPAPGNALPALVLVTGLATSAPAWAGVAEVAPAVLWFVLGQATALAVMLVLVWKQLSERALPRRDWQVHALATGASLLLCLWLLGRWPVLALAIAVPVLVWGLVLFLRLVRRMRELLDERDHARAEAKRVQRDSERDPLTGALNRGAWRQRLDQLASDGLSARPPKPLSVLFFDIDLFKLINDSLGHGVGDDCLKAVAATVAAELRGGDLLGRMGGEEFAVVLPGARRTHGIAVGERIRMAVQEHCRVVGEEVVELTVSIGVAEYLGEPESLDVLVDRADRAMYSAKDSGRNMVVADPSAPAPL